MAATTGTTGTTSPTSPTIGSKDTIRVSFEFSREAYDELQRLARERNTSLSRVVRDALRLERFAHETRKKGGQILVKEDGRLGEIVAD